MSNQSRVAVMTGSNLLAQCAPPLCTIWVQNRITKDIKEGAIAGFARHGSNGRGEGGFAGFCYYLAKRHPKAAARIVEKLLPLQVNGTGLGNSAIGTVNIVSVPVGTYLSAEDIQKIQPAPPLIEHGPQPERIDDVDEDIGPIEVVEAAPAEPEVEVETGRQVIQSAKLRARQGR